jgi:hypothetical protein
MKVLFTKMWLVCMEIKNIQLRIEPSRPKGGEEEQLPKHKGCEEEPPWKEK